MASVLAREGEALSPMASSKCLATLYWLTTLPDPQADLVLAGELAARPPGP